MNAHIKNTANGGKNKDETEKTHERHVAVKQRGEEKQRRGRKRAGTGGRAAGAHERSVAWGGAVRSEGGVSALVGEWGWWLR